MNAIKARIKAVLHNILPQKLAALYDRLEELLWYAFFGVLTTAVNFAVYLLLTRLILRGAFAENEAGVTLLSNWCAWAAAVVFAFVVNKRCVFENREGGKRLLWQFGSFVFMRLASGVFENFVPTGLILWLKMDDVLAKALVAVAVIVANYFFSKFVSFRRKNKADAPALPQEECAGEESEAPLTEGNRAPEAAVNPANDNAPENENATQNGNEPVSGEMPENENAPKEGNAE